MLHGLLCKCDHQSLLPLLTHPARPWLYPAEIFPLNVRTKGNAWGVVGWSIGNGWLTLLCPVMFDALSQYTLFIFAACNIITLPMVYCLYPEVCFKFPGKNTRSDDPTDEPAYPRTNEPPVRR